MQAGSSTDTGTGPSTGTGTVTCLICSYINCWYITLDMAKDRFSTFLWVSPGDKNNFDQLWLTDKMLKQDIDIDHEWQNLIILT